MAPKHLAAVAALAAALALAALPAALAVERPPWTLADVGTGKGAPANCTFDGALGGNWLEITQAGGPYPPPPPPAAQPAHRAPLAPTPPTAC